MVNITDIILPDGEHYIKTICGVHKSSYLITTQYYIYPKPETDGSISTRYTSLQEYTEHCLEWSTMKL